MSATCHLQDSSRPKWNWSSLLIWYASYQDQMFGWLTQKSVDNSVDQVNVKSVTINETGVSPTFIKLAIFTCR